MWSGCPINTAAKKLQFPAGDRPPVTSIFAQNPGWVDPRQSRGLDSLSLNWTPYSTNPAGFPETIQTLYCPRRLALRTEPIRHSHRLPPVRQPRRNRTTLNEPIETGHPGPRKTKPSRAGQSAFQNEPNGTGHPGPRKTKPSRAVQCSLNFRTNPIETGHPGPHKTKPKPVRVVRTSERTQRKPATPARAKRSQVGPGSPKVRTNPISNWPPRTRTKRSQTVGPGSPHFRTNPMEPATRARAKRSQNRGRAVRTSERTHRKKTGHPARAKRSQAGPGRAVRTSERTQRKPATRTRAKRSQNRAGQSEFQNEPNRKPATRARAKRSQNRAGQSGTSERTQGKRTKPWSPRVRKSKRTQAFTPPARVRPPRRYRTSAEPTS